MHILSMRQSYKVWKVLLSANEKAQAIYWNVYAHGKNVRNTLRASYALNRECVMIKIWTINERMERGKTRISERKITKKTGRCHWYFLLLRFSLLKKISDIALTVHAHCASTHFVYNIVSFVHVRPILSQYKLILRWFSCEHLVWALHCAPSIFRVKFNEPSI